MSMPAAGQKFATDDASVFGSAEEASACVKRLLAKTGTSVVEEHRVTSSTKSSTTSAIDYLQDSFDFLHQRHMKNLSDVIARHQRQQQPAAGQEEQVQAGLSQLSQQQQRHKKQVHIHQSAFYDGLGQNGLSDATNDMQQNTFKSTKTINLSNNNSTSSNSSVDLDDAKMLQQTQQRRCARENSTSSLQSQSSVSSARSESFDNCNNNFCDAVSSVSNKSNTTKISSKSSTSSSSTSSTSSSTTRMQQSFSSSKKVVKQSFSSSSQDFEDRMGIDVMLTPSLGGPAAPGTPTTPSTPVGTVALPEMASASTKKVKQTTKVSSSSSMISSSSDQPDQVECKQSSKVFKAKTVKKSVSDGRQVHTDVDKYSETAEEEAEGSPDKPVITFSHVSSEGSHQAFTDNIVRFDSSTLSSPSRSRSPSPLLEMPAPYNDLAKEIKRPPMEKA
ncbi:uncharacterized protein DDB_G0271670-like [Thrips palmi]|uniref:Uncharacterized protein DDB_G0271670-like n=1 Tax=Thrips palmi TaxID=161013 RepID=A0A6P8YX36_THRPL|nr:uncharacterized protein DDB_G0271670-like [Thrips palmi]